ncbi:MAG TPA: 5'/3'-nucleotidase SurE [Kofleriaceae bacterium]|nr:5'/3'-nucleotidase SurE [Kofleriaceae bacterium]
MRPLVLLTNDDGIISPHLRHLADALEDVAEVLVVAPERQRSAASHAITLHKPLRLHEIDRNRFALSGTPVDCVYVGMLKLAPRPPSLVISGINDGYNLGSDVFYSGTVAGAIEGALRGAVGIAVSMAPRATDVAGVVRFARALVKKALAEPLHPGNVLNVNAPGVGETEVAWTILGKRRYHDDVAERKDPRGRPYYWIGGGVSGHDEIGGSDCEAVARGAISVTPLNLDLTHASHVQAPPWDLADHARW